MNCKYAHVDIIFLRCLYTEVNQFIDTMDERTMQFYATKRSAAARELYNVSGLDGFTGSRRCGGSEEKTIEKGSRKLFQIRTAFVTYFYLFRKY